MMSPNIASIDHISEALKKLSKFITPLLPLASCHMVDYITSNHWENLLPERIRVGLMKVPRDQLHHLPSATLYNDEDSASSSVCDWNMLTSDLPSYLTVIRQHSLASHGVLTPIDEILETYGTSDVTTLAMKGVMSEKKTHEVEVMSKIICHFTKGSGVDWIVDIGSGKGYLSTSLALQYSLNVVAIDSSQENTSAALIRKSKLQKYWKSLKKGEEDRLRGKPLRKGRRRKKKIKPLEECKNDVHLQEDADAASSELSLAIGRHIAVTSFITENTDLLEIVKDSIKEDKEEGDRLKLTEELIGAVHLGERLESDSGVCGSNNSNCSEGIGETHLKGSANMIGDTEPVCIESSDLLDNHETLQNTNVCRLGLVGLHTCGNLAPSSLKLFLSNPTVNFLCNVGCCYHLIEEEFSRNPYVNYTKVDEDEVLGATDDVEERDVTCQKFPPSSVNPLRLSEIPNPSLGFPLSKTLQNLKFSLGRNSRMLSCQSTDRLNCKDLSSTMALYWRALLQVLLIEKVGDISDIAHVGRIAAKCQTFTEYAHTAFTKLKIDIKITEEELKEFEERYSNHVKEMERFFMFRASLAPVIEGIILLDRLAFLREQGVDSAYLVQLFDPVTSPRCHALIAFRPG